MDYAALKLTHQVAVVLSVAGFAARGPAVFADAAWSHGRVARTLPHLVDTVLLGTALAMAWMLRLTPGNAPWLTANIGGLLLYIGLGMGSGCQSVLSGALWAELFGIERLGMVRGVFTALMVLSTAASPPLLGLALQNQVPLTLLASAVAIYAVVMPWIVARWVRAPIATVAPA